MRPDRDNEGQGIGCWFYIARGSGVFINVGRTLVFRTREKALATQGFGVWKNGVASYSDHNVAGAAARQGFRSVQLLFGNRFAIYARNKTFPTHELILAHSACMQQPAKTPCVPAALRAGWQATLPCTCANAAKVGAAGLKCTELRDPPLTRP